MLWWIPALPLAGFLALTLARVPRRAAAIVGCGSVAASLAAACSASVGGPRREILWSWLDGVPVALQIDALSTLFAVVITGVGLLIHIYSVEYMADDEGLRRFFAWMNLFIASMLVLVLADNLLLLYAGWEGVGLCSFVLIGFWYRVPKNAAAARKAFLMTRLGDSALLVGIVWIWATVGTLRFEELTAPIGLAGLLLLAGAAGKSAQVPLQTWLPDAMAGPTPVSALLHAATMVTAGVYLLARCRLLLSPAVLTAVAVVGAVTLLVGATSALAQRDLKRILAYSTMSQIGLMFLAIGVGAWTAAVFHFVTHSFFKALLFLSAGAVILSTGHEQDVTRLGGLRRKLPLAFWTFLIGAASLAGLPFVTAGFYSKDLILASARGAPAFFAAGIAGSFLTALYAFRALFLVFFGQEKTAPDRQTGFAVAFPLAALSSLAVVGGFLSLPWEVAHPSLATQALLGIVPLAGLVSAWVLYRYTPEWFERTAQWRPSLAASRAMRGGWGFDRIYDLFVVRQFVAVAAYNRSDVADALPRWVAAAGRHAHEILRRTQTGRMRWYAAGVTAGSILLLALAVFR